MIVRNNRKELLPEMSSLLHQSQNWSLLEIYRLMLPTIKYHNFDILLLVVSSMLLVEILFKEGERNRMAKLQNIMASLIPVIEN